MRALLLMARDLFALVFTLAGAFAALILATLYFGG